MKDVFIALLNMSISVTWLIAAVVLVRAFLGKAPKWIRGVLWAMVALRLVIPFTLESPVSLVPSVQITVETPSEQAEPVIDDGGNVQSEEQVYTPPVVDIPKPDISASESPMVDIPKVDIPEIEGEEGGAFEEFPVTNEPVLTPEEPAEDTPAAVSGEAKGVDIGFICSIIWAVGALVMAVYCVGSYWRLKIRLMGAVRVDEGVYESGWIKSAFVLGIIKPIIYIPQTLPAEEREYVIAHERVHISRFDYIFKPLGFLILALHWFNPTVWLAYILYCRDIELACDEKVIKGYTVDQIKGYSKALVSCGEGHRGMLGCPIAFGEVGIKARVKSILNYKKPAFWIIIGAVAVCVIVAVCFMTVRSDESASDPTDSAESSETTESTESTESTDGTEEPTDGTKPTDITDPTDSREPTEPDEPTDDPAEEPTDDSTDPTDPTEPSEPDDPTDPTEPSDPIDPVDPVVFDEPKYNYVPRSEYPSGFSQVFDLVYTNKYNYSLVAFGNVTGVVTEIQRTTETFDIYKKCYMGFDFIYTYEELQAAIEKYKEDTRGNEDISVLEQYDREYFEDNVLVSTYRSFNSGALNYNISAVFKNGSELAFYVRTNLYRSTGEYAYIAVVESSVRIYEMSKSSLDGINTVSLYAEDMYSDNQTLPHLGAHVYSDATCTKPATCILCGTKKNDVLAEHTYTDATCTKPAACKICGVTKGEALGHDMEVAPTCTEAGVCSRCGIVTGNALGHDFSNNICKRNGCGEHGVIYDNVVYSYSSNADDTYNRYELGQLDCKVALEKKYELSMSGGNQYAEIAIRLDSDYVHWEKSCVRGYVDGVLTDLGYVKLSDDGQSIIIRFTGEGEYLIDIHYGNADMPYVTTVSLVIDHLDLRYS